MFKELDLAKHAGRVRDRLVELFMQKIRSVDASSSATCGASVQELRTVFRFIRNNILHNLREVDRAATLAALLQR